MNQGVPGLRSRHVMSIALYRNLAANVYNSSSNDLDYVSASMVSACPSFSAIPDRTHLFVSILLYFIGPAEGLNRTDTKALWK